MEKGWRPEDFESPIVFVWLTKTKKESLYAVHESSPAVKYHLLTSRPAPAVPGWDPHLVMIRPMENGDLVNGEWSLAYDQESSDPAVPSGDPSSRDGIQGQWTIMDLSR